MNFGQKSQPVLPGCLKATMESGLVCEIRHWKTVMQRFNFLAGLSGRRGNTGSADHCASVGPDLGLAADSDRDITVISSRLLENGHVSVRNSQARRSLASESARTWAILSRRVARRCTRCPRAPPGLSPPPRRPRLSRRVARARRPQALASPSPPIRPRLGRRRGGARSPSSSTQGPSPPAGLSWASADPEPPLAHPRLGSEWPLDAADRPRRGSAGRRQTVPSRACLLCRPPVRATLALRVLSAVAGIGRRRRHETSRQTATSPEPRNLPCAIPTALFLPLRHSRFSSRGGWCACWAHEWA